MEKAPSSVSIGNIRGEMTWMPEKASACNRTSGAKAPEFSTLFGTAEAVPSRRAFTRRLLTSSGFPWRPERRPQS